MEKGRLGDLDDRDDRMAGGLDDRENVFYFRRKKLRIKKETRGCNNLWRKGVKKNMNALIISE